MYFPLGWPKYLTDPRQDSLSLQYVISSCDRMLFAVISDDTVSVWYSKPSVLIVSFTQSQEDVEKLGKYQLAEWKPDSSMIAVMTSKRYIVFFKVILDISVPNHNCLYVSMEGRRHAIRTETVGISDGCSIPAIKITPAAYMELPSSISCCICVRDELMVAMTDGSLLRVKWTATINDKASFNVFELNVSIDFQQTKAARPSEADGHVTMMEYSPIIGGYVLVMSSGRAMFVVPPSSRQENTSAQGVWVTDMKDASCLAINHRYRLMAFGCKSAIGVVYVINETEGTIEESHRLQISSKDYPDALTQTGAVHCMKWTPDGTALALCWRNGGFSLWSVFGSLLLCSLGGESFPDDGQRLFPHPIKSMEWALEGYQLWIVSEGTDRVEEDFVGVGLDSSRVMQLQFVKSALTVNPCSANHEHVFLQGEDKLYINIGDNCTSHHSSNFSHQQMSIGNKIWQIVPISHQYLSTNWPIRYSAVDKSGQYLAVAGKTGLAHYTFYTRKWKLFGNETQEKDLVVSGGMSWWKDFICVASYHITAQRDEIRCYPRNSKLDNTFAVAVKVPSQILLLNTYKDTLTVFCIDSHIMLFNLERKNLEPNPTIELKKVQEVSLNNFVPHPVCVTGLVLTLLRTEFGVRGQHSPRDSECLLLNVAGKLLMFQRDQSAPRVQEQSQKQTKSKPLPFATPSVVATNVENMWSTSRASQGKMQLLEALWLSCGTQGMKVWLPLYPKSEGKAQNFLSKRIMLPFGVDIYPLAVLFEDAVILGAASDATSYHGNVTKAQEQSKKNTHHLPFYTLERTSQIYLHHILRQLLRRNLGVNALDLARCCTELGYFPHVLELLLHEVLEAEATSKEPVPDPLLPRVVAFIMEFPEYLQTVVHCARKTEVALWPYLFSAVGNPKDLFEQCLMNEQLDTAASYLIILQNLERPATSRQHATLLLDKALEVSMWHLARDLVRFLKAIEPSDDDTPPITGSLRVNTSSGFTPGYPSPPITPPDTEGFQFSSVSNLSNLSRIRSSSVTGTDVQNVPPPKKKLSHTLSDNFLHSKKTSPKPKEEGTPDHMYIDMILCRHCRKLLESNRLRDIGYFSANIEGFQLVAWLRRERVRAAKVDDFVSAVRDLHHQFEWPLPILSYSVFQQLKDKTLSTPSLQSLSLLDSDMVNVGEHNNHLDYHQYLAGLRATISDPNLAQSDDIVLKPHIQKTEDSSLATVEASDNSSLLEYDEMTESNSFSDLLSPELEILSHEMANKGPRQSELELRYLLQILLEAGCLEWAIIISMVLRDVEAVIRTVNTASMTDTPLETVARMREGISYLELWADTECLGYKPFLHFIRKQIHVLGKLAEQAPPTLQLSSSPEEASDDAPLSPVMQTIRNDSETHTDNVKVTTPDAKPNECALA
ncbi:hypothetical protein FSP39_022283 [Pinctada imbricata]|uniref:Protein RIC1 homolog n=1 Tax=Pinctada imbricata TaxID=66713 RepID=A0AA88XU34_PINIB|nr:hypothetical protein FSP39_022283 [Pinctada imbricata]